jgi:hypothetical protein
MKNQDTYKKISRAINEPHYRRVVSRLNDLSEKVVSKSIIQNRHSYLVPPDDITDLEKAIVCVALYWLDKDIKEDGFCKNTSAKVTFKTLSAAADDYGLG